MEDVHLLHSVPRAKLPDVLRQGLKASSRFDDLGLALRRGVVYCWLSAEHDKMWGRDPAYVYVEVSVDPARCRVADMEFSSMALMYREGQGDKPKNRRAADLLARLYEETSIALDEYSDGMFWTPEVLVRGDISLDHIAVAHEPV